MLTHLWSHSSYSPSPSLSSKMCKRRSLDSRPLEFSNLCSISSHIFPMWSKQHIPLSLAQFSLSPHLKWALVFCRLQAVWRQIEMTGVMSQGHRPSLSGKDSPALCTTLALASTGCEHPRACHPPGSHLHSGLFSTAVSIHRLQASSWVPVASWLPRRPGQQEKRPGRARDASGSCWNRRFHHSDPTPTPGLCQIIYCKMLVLRQESFR